MHNVLGRMYAWFGTRNGSAFSLIVVGCLTLWFAAPAFSIAYTEGFQPSIAIGAYALTLHNPAIADELYPLCGRFYLLTRLGTSVVLAGLTHGLHITSLQAFQILSVTSLAVILGCIVFLLHRIYGIRPALSLLACILFPAIFEAAYLPNDDMPSGALVCIAFAIWWTKPTYMRALLSGIILGIAAALRLDAVIIAPAFAILLMTEVKSWKARATQAALMGVAVASIVIGTYKLFGLSFFDSLATVKIVLRMMLIPHGISGTIKGDFQTIIFSITALGALGWLIGVGAFVRSRNWRDLALVVVVPAIYFIAYGAQLVEGRYLLPLSIFICLAIANGFRAIPSLFPHLRTAALVAVVIGIGLFVVPPKHSLSYKHAADSDGPHLVFGRIWNPLIARWWQARLNLGQSLIEADIEKLSAIKNPLIVTGYWNSDRLVTLLLLEHGYSIDMSTVSNPCKGIAEGFRRGGTVITQIKTHVPILQPRSERVTWQHVGEPCAIAAFSANYPVLFIDSDTVLPQSGPHVEYSLMATPLPSIAPNSIGLLPGMTIASLPVASVTEAYRTRQVLTPTEEMKIRSRLAERKERLR